MFVNNNYKRATLLRLSFYPPKLLGMINGLLDPPIHCAVQTSDAS
jgi:hypothetical protein